MCLCAFLYFTEFSTLNINYFCNQKKHTVIKSIKNVFSIQFLHCLCHSVTDRFPHNSVQKEPTVHGYPQPLWCWSRHTENHRVPPKYQSIVKTLRSVSIATRQGHGSVWALPEHGDGRRAAADSRITKGGVTKGPRRLAARQWGQASQGLRRPVAL